MSMAMTQVQLHRHQPSVPTIVAHIFRPKPIQPKARPQPLIGILAELATAGSY
jgi:hypothetical protein